MTRIRKAVAGLTLVAMLAAPMSALAADPTLGDTSENLNVTVAASLSATFPGTQTYVRNAANTGYTWLSPITAVNSNSPNGVNIDVKVDPYVATLATIPTTARQMEPSGATGGLTAGIDVMPGGFGDSTSSHTVATAPGVVVNGSVNVRMSVFDTAFATVPAGTHSFTSAVHWTVATNQ